MIQINPDNMIKVELTPKEIMTLLQYCHSIDDDMYDRIQNARNGVLHLLIEDCYYLKGLIQAAIQTAKKPKIQDILGSVFNKLSPNPVTRNIAQELEGHDFESIDDLNEHLQDIMTNRNTSPDPEMGGLSPEQVTRLIYLNWDDNNFPLKFNKELKYSDIKDSIFFTNTVIFLKNLIELEKEPTATATGNLNRKTVKILLDKFVIAQDIKDYILKYNKVVNEEDVFHVHVFRIVLESAGIIHKRNKKILVTKKYQNLILEENAGQLYYLLFETYLRKFNLAYLDRLPEVESIQDTIAYSIYRLGEIADSWIGLEGLFEKILLPAVRNEIRKNISDSNFIEWLLCSRIIEPLSGFGLLECKYKGGKKANLERFRKTELFDKFVRREW